MNDRKQFRFWLNADEYETALNFSMNYNMSITKLAKFFLLNRKLPTTKNEYELVIEREKLRKELNQIGINLNQVARKLNSFSPEQLTHDGDNCLTEIKEEWEEIYSTINELEINYLASKEG